jgi:hypothetical protein
MHVYYSVPALCRINDARALYKPYLARNRTLTELRAAGDADAASRALDHCLHNAERQVLAALPLG